MAVASVSNKPAGIFSFLSPMRVLTHLQLSKIKKALNLIVARPALASLEAVEAYIKEYKKLHNSTIEKQELASGQAEQEGPYNPNTILRVTDRHDQESKRIRVYFYNNQGELKQEISLDVADEKTIWVSNKEIKRVGDTTIKLTLAYSEGKLFHVSIDVIEVGSARHYYQPKDSTKWYRMLMIQPEGKGGLVNQEDLGDLDSTDIPTLNVCVALFNGQGRKK